MRDQGESPGALAGIRVVDLSRVLGGPFCTQILGDHGAEVVKIEPPSGDETRDYGPPFITDAEGRITSSAYYRGVNRNKRAIALDLGKAQGRAVVLRLLESADVLVENFKAGTMERWGMGYDDVLKDRFPGLVHCRITGFGADGPLGAKPGYDAVAQAMSGLVSVNGSPESGPMRLGIPVVDLVTGINAAVGITMALVERARSGRGQFIDATLFDTGVSLLHPHAAGWFVNGELPRLMGSAHAYVAPYDTFQTKDQPVFLAVANDRHFRKLSAVLGRPELADDRRFKTNADRSNNRQALSAILAPLLATWECGDLCDRLEAAGIAAGPVNDIGEVLTGAHARHRGMVVDKDGYRGLGPPVKLSRTPPSVRLAPPDFAADSRQVLASAGYEDAEIEALIDCGAVVLERRK